MDSAGKELLIASGVNLHDAMERFMNNEKLYTNYLNRFAANPDFYDLEAAVAGGDWEKSLSISHNLKGVSGSLGFTKLYEMLTLQVNLFRQEDNDGAAALMSDIMAEYKRILDVAKQVI